MPKHKLSHHTPYAKGEHGDGVMSLEELNASDHLCPHHAGVAPLPDAQREIWYKEESDPYPMEPEETPHG